MSTTLNAIRLAELAHKLADRACIADIECEAVIWEDHEHGRCWYDTRPMLDEREHSSDFVEMNRQALAYAQQRGLISPHPQHAHLVRIVRMPR